VAAELRRFLVRIDFGVYSHIFVYYLIVVIFEYLKLSKCSFSYIYRTMVTICTARWSLHVPHSTYTAQWSLYVPHSGQYMYRTVVTTCTAQWSLHVPQSGHYMYRTVVSICTAQWSLYILHSGHYIYRTVVTTCTAQWSLYVPHSDHYMYSTVVIICTTRFNTQQFYVLPTQCIYVFCVELRTATISLYSIN